jgi:uncharacterized membrane protein (DUF485 family)
MINNLSNSFDAVSVLGFGMGFFVIGTILFFALVIAMVALKGYALWTAARRSEKGWFIALLVINTFGILELIYLYFVAGVWKKQTSETPSPAPTSTTPPTTQSPAPNAPESKP